jgi:uncharacterized protein
MNQTFHLYQLQKVDRQLHALEKRIAEIDAVIKNDRRIVEVENIISQIKARIEKLKRELRSLEEVGKSIRLEIETNEASLYSGTIRNPKELNDLQQKINIDKKNLDKNDEAQLELLMSIEEYEAELDRYQKKMTAVESEVATSHSLLLGEKSQLQKQKETLETERSAKSSSLQESTLTIYAKLIREKHGVAVALVEDLSCTVCGAPMTPAEWQSARSSSSLSFCSSCGRILYAG